MEENILFSALSTSLLISVIQGLIVFSIVKTLLSSAPTMSAKNRFNFLYGAMLLIFAGFIITMASTYSNALTLAEGLNPDLLISSNYSSRTALTETFHQNANYTRWIAVLYFTGILIRATIILAGFYQLSIFKQKSMPWNNNSWEERLQTLCLTLKIYKDVKLHLAERVFSPFTAGFIKPVIIFPIAMLSCLSPAQVEAILLHELGHIKRNDYLLNVFHKIIETILFFNPFVWLLSVEIRREREFACDDLVMENTSDTTHYALALLQIAESNLKNYAFSMAASGNNNFSLFNRIKRLKNVRTHQNNPKSGLLALLSIGAAFVSLACIIPTGTDIPKTEKAAVYKEVSPVPFTYHVQSGVKSKPLRSLPTLKTALKALPALAADTDTNHVNEYFNGPEWKKQMEDLKSHVSEMKKQFESPEWKKHIQDMKVNSEEMKKHFDSPAWKKQMQDMKVHSEEMKKHFDSPEWKKQVQDMKIHSEEMKKHFDSPEWKKQMQDMKINSEEMKKRFDNPEWKKQMEDIKSRALSMKKEFDSPEWKKKIEDMKANAMDIKKQFDSPEWKQKIEHMKVHSEYMRKKIESPEWKKQIEEIKKMSQEIKIEAEKKPVTPKN